MSPVQVEDRRFLRIASGSVVLQGPDKDGDFKVEGYYGSSFFKASDFPDILACLKEAMARVDLTAVA